MDQDGSLSVQRYLDRAGTIAQGSASTASITANTPVVPNIPDGKPYQMFTITITYSSDTPANASAFAVLLNANRDRPAGSPSASAPLRRALGWAR
jgi:hypothetical protein